MWGGWSGCGLRVCESANGRDFGRCGGVGVGYGECDLWDGVVSVKRRLIAISVYQGIGCMFHEMRN